MVVTKKRSDSNGRRLALLQHRLRRQAVLLKEKAETERQLRELVAKYSTAVEQSVDAILIVQGNEFRFANRAVHAVYGYEPSEMVGMCVKTTVAPESRRLVEKRLRRKSAGGYTAVFYEMKVRRKDGGTRDVEVFTKDVQYEGRPASMAIVRDITSRRQAELKIGQRGRELDALYGGLVSIAQTFDLKESLREVCRQVDAATGSIFSCIVVPDQDGEILITDDRLPSRCTAERPLHIGAVMPRIIGEASPVLVNDCCIRPRGRKDFRIRSWAGIPIGVKNSVLGALFVHSLEPKAFAQDLGLLSAFANQAAIAIKNGRLYEAIKTEQARVEMLLGKVITAQEDERRRLSLDLHDSVAQSMYGTLARIRAAEQLFSQSKYEHAKAEIAQVRAAVEHTLVDLRRVAIDLHPPALDAVGLCEALRQLAAEFSQSSPRIDCAFSIGGLPVRLPGTSEIAAFRIVQEALSNVRKHASATRVSVRVRFLARSVRIVVRDNGRGFDFSSVEKQQKETGHLGLAGMVERAELVAGSVDVQAAPGKGTTVRLSIPVSALEVA